MVNCKQSGCNYPEGECMGICTPNYQPKALYLADVLSAGFECDMEWYEVESAIELRRLHAENGRLKTDLQAMHSTLEMTAKSGASYAASNEILRETILRWVARAEKAEDMLEAIGAGGVGSTVPEDAQ